MRKRVGWGCIGGFLCGVIAWGCLSHTSSPYNATSALNDLKSGQVRLISYGLPEARRIEFAALDRKYGFQRVNLGCVVDKQAEQGLEAYNEVVEHYLKKRNGADWRSKYEREEDSLKKLFREPTPDPIVLTHGTMLIEDGRWQNMLSLGYRREGNNLYGVLKRDFGIPAYKGGFAIYKCGNERFWKETVILRVSSHWICQEDIPDYEIISVAAESIDGHDLLIPYTKTQKVFANYLSTMQTKN